MYAFQGACACINVCVFGELKCMRSSVRLVFIYLTLP